MAMAARLSVHPRNPSQPAELAKGMENDDVIVFVTVNKVSNPPSLPRAEKVYMMLLHRYMRL